MPYHTYTNLIFATLSGLGTGLLIFRLTERRAYAFWLAPALLVLPILTFERSEASSSQRDHWFGWMFGHDILKRFAARECHDRRHAIPDALCRLT